MTKALILSLGGTPEPLARSIAHFAPQAVCFLASQQSVEVIPQVKALLPGPIRDHKVLIVNPNDLLDCYHAAHTCWHWLEHENLTGESVGIDYTGGTKVMSVALALLGIEKGCHFVYIGGDERNKAGLGQVITGTEQVFQGASPWQALAVAEQREGAAYFNQSQFAASAQCFARGLEMVRWQAGQAAVLLGILKGLATGYDLWDRFQHKDARESIKAAYATLQTYAATTADKEANVLVEQVQANLDFLDALMQQSYGFKRPCSLHLPDLLSSAERRAAEGRFDDGVIRLYRALELVEQLALQHRGIDPAVEKLALQNGFLRLAELDDPLGKLFEQRKEDFQKVQQARNYSWLVHGTQVLKQDTYRDLKGLVLDLAQVTEAELPTFPRLGTG